MSTAKEHIVNTYVGKKGLYRESGVFISVIIEKVSIKNSIVYIQGKKILPYSFSYQEEEFIDYELNSENEKFNISGREDIISYSEYYFYIAYVGGVLYFDNTAVTKFEKKDKSFIQSLF